MHSAWFSHDAFMFSQLMNWPLQVLFSAFVLYNSYGVSQFMASKVSTPLEAYNLKAIWAYAYVKLVLTLVLTCFGAYLWWLVISLASLPSYLPRYSLRWRSYPSSPGVRLKGAWLFNIIKVRMAPADALLGVADLCPMDLPFILGDIWLYMSLGFPSSTGWKLKCDANK